MEKTLSTTRAVEGYGGALVAFVVTAFFAADVIGEYFVNTSYFFALGWWYEFAVTLSAAVIGVALAGFTFFRRRR